MWQLINPIGAKPSGRHGHVGAWSTASNGLYIHGGRGLARGRNRVSKAVQRSCGSSAGRRSGHVAPRDVQCGNGILTTDSLLLHYVS